MVAVVRPAVETLNPWFTPPLSVTVPVNTSVTSTGADGTVGLGPLSQAAANSERATRAARDTHTTVVRNIFSPETRAGRTHLLYLYRLQTEAAEAHLID